MINIKQAMVELFKRLKNLETDEDVRPSSLHQEIQSFLRELGLPTSELIIESIALAAAPPPELADFFVASVADASDANPQFFWNRKVFDELSQLAAKLTKDFPNTRFIGVGNSPSYVIYSVDSYARHHGLDIETHYAPFSQAFLWPDKNSKATGNVYKTVENQDHYAAMLHYKASYRKFLESSFGLHPRKIVDDHARFGTKTAFLDFLREGKSYASFLSFMFSWAQDVGINYHKFSQAVTCIGLHSEDLSARIVVPEQRLYIDLALIPVSKHLAACLNGNHSIENDRFVPFYSPLEWGQPPKAVPEKNDFLVTQIKQRIDNAVRGEPDRDIPLVVPGNLDDRYRHAIFANMEVLSAAFEEQFRADRLAEKAKGNSRKTPDKKERRKADKPKHLTNNHRKKHSKQAREAAQEERLQKAVTAVAASEANAIDMPVPLHETNSEPVMLVPISEPLPESAERAMVVPAAPVVTEEQQEAQPQIAPVEATTDESLNRRREAGQIGLRLIRAFNEMDQQLTPRHTAIFTHVTGVGRNWRPSSIEAVARQVHETPQSVARKLDEVRNYFDANLTTDQYEALSSDAIVEGLRAFENAPGMDLAFTQQWLALGSVEAAAEASGRPQETIKGARSRVLAQVAQAILRAGF